MIDSLEVLSPQKQRILEKYLSSDVVNILFCAHTIIFSSWSLVSEVGVNQQWNSDTLPKLKLQAGVVSGTIERCCSASKKPGHFWASNFQSLGIHPPQPSIFRSKPVVRQAITSFQSLKHLYLKMYLLEV